MPAALELDRNEVRIVAVQIGVREAARQFGLSEETVMSWSKREGWLREKEEQEEIVERAKWQKRESQGLPAVARTASEILKSYDGDTRMGLAKGLKAGADHVAQLDGQEVLMAAGQVAQLAKASGLVHNWQANSAGISIRMDIVSQCSDSGPVIDV